MGDNIDFTKTSAEKFSIAIDFTNRWPTGATALSSATFAAYKQKFPNGPRTLASSTVLLSTTGSVDSKTASATVQAGANGYSYLITCAATCDDGSIVEHGVVMLIQDF